MDKLPEGPAGGAKRIEFVDGESVFCVSTGKLRKFAEQGLQDFLRHWIFNARTHFDIAAVESYLPRIWRGDHQVASNQFAPMHVVAKGRRQQPQAISALLKELVCFLEH